MSDFVIRPVTGQPISAVAGPVRAVLPVAPVGQSGAGSLAQDSADLARSDRRAAFRPRPAVTGASAAPDRGADRPYRPEAGAPSGSEAARIALSRNQVGPPPAFPINVLEAEAQRRAAGERARCAKTQEAEAAKRTGRDLPRVQADRPPADGAPLAAVSGFAEEARPPAAGAHGATQAPYPGQPVSPANAPSGTGPPARVDLHL